MRKFSYLLIPALIAMTIMAFPTPGHADTRKVILQIEGMICIACPSLIKMALEGLEGVEKADISFKEKRGDICFDSERVSVTEIVNKVNQTRFKAKVVAELSSRTQC